MRTKYKKIFILSALVIALIYFFAGEAKDVLSVKTIIPLDTLNTHDCGVVLTGGPGRIRESFEVLAQKKIRKLVISGVFKEAQLHEIFPQLPFYPEVQPEDIILEKVSGSTYGNAVQSLAVVKTLGCQQVLLMTSQLHMYRAYRIFRTLFPAKIQITQYPIPHSGKEYPLLDIFIETFKSMFYSAFGRVL